MTKIEEQSFQEFIKDIENTLRDVVSKRDEVILRRSVILNPNHGPSESSVEGQFLAVISYKTIQHEER